MNGFYANQFSLFSCIAFNKEVLDVRCSRNVFKSRAVRKRCATSDRYFEEKKTFEENDPLLGFSLAMLSKNAIIIGVSFHQCLKDFDETYFKNFQIPQNLMEYTYSSFHKRHSRNTPGKIKVENDPKKLPKIADFLLKLLVLKF